MSTVPSNESSHSDFLQLEQVTPPVLEERWDLDRELRSLLEMANNSGRPSTLEHQQALCLESQQLVQSIALVKSELADMQCHSQEQVQSIEHGLNQSKQLQQRTEQLAKYSKLQVRKMQEMLQSFDSIRHSIVVALDKFGNYQQLEPMLQKILAADLSLRQANEKLQTDQSELSESVQNQGEQRSSVAEQNLLKGQAEFERLLQQDFTALAESIQHEKQQFYQLTADTINKTDAMRSQFAEIAKQVTKNEETVQSLQLKLAELQEHLDAADQQQFSQLPQRYDELVTSWSDLKKKQVGIEKSQKNQQTWLQILSSGLLVTLLILIVIVAKSAH